MSSARIIHLPTRRSPQIGAPDRTRLTARPSSGDILLVEDDDADAKLFVWYAGKAGIPVARIKIARTLAEADRLVREQHFDLVVFDYWVGPDCSGPMISAMVTAPEAPPVLVLSNLSPEEMHEVYCPHERLSIMSKGDLGADVLARNIAVLLTPNPANRGGPDPESKNRVCMKALTGDLRAIVDRLEDAIACADAHLSSGEVDVAHSAVIAATGQITDIKAKLDRLQRLITENAPKT